MEASAVSRRADRAIETRTLTRHDGVRELRDTEPVRDREQRQPTAERGALFDRVDLPELASQSNLKFITRHQSGTTHQVEPRPSREVRRDDLALAHRHRQRRHAAARIPAPTEELLSRFCSGREREEAATVVTVGARAHGDLSASVGHDRERILAGRQRVEQR